MIADRHLRLNGHGHSEVEELEQDEVDIIVASLRLLARMATMPVVRVCLEEARTDIAHLASTKADVAEMEDDDAGWDGAAAEAA